MADLSTNFALLDSGRGPMVNIDPRFVDRVEVGDGQLFVFFSKRLMASSPYDYLVIAGTLDSLYEKFPAYRDWLSITAVYKNRADQHTEEYIREKHNIFNPDHVICIKEYSRFGEGTEIQFRGRHTMRSSYSFQNIFQRLQEQKGIRCVFLTECEFDAPIAVPVNAIASIIVGGREKGGTCVVNFGEGIEPIPVWESFEKIKEQLDPVQNIWTILQPPTAAPESAVRPALA